MAKILETEQRQEARELKYLVIDDEIAKNQRYRQNFIEDLGLSNMSAEFAANCEDALTIIKQDSSIVFCFLDCRLPKSKESSYNYSPQNNVDAGINLIPEISKISNNFPIIIFSAYVDRDKLKEKTANCSSDINIIEYLNKDESLDRYTAATKKALKYLNISIDSFNIKTNKVVENIEVEEKSFDYEQLDVKTQLIIKEKTLEIKKLLRKSAQDICDIGKFLTEVKQSLKHGQFYPWLKLELKWSPTSASRFMKVYEKFKSFNLNDLDIVPSALYELSNSAIPNEVLEETIGIAEVGKGITLETAKLIKKQYQEKEKLEGISSSKSVVDPKISTDDANDTKPNYNPKQIVDLQPVFKNSVDAERLSAKQNIVKIIPRQNQWQIKKHKIVCANPNSEVFKKLLPNKVSLVLDFSPEREWNYSFVEYDSISVFKTRHEDIDDAGLLSLVQNAVEITTEEEDNVALVHIPNSRILLLLDKLGCQVFVAEPNYSKCLALVEVSKSIVSPNNLS